MRLRTALGWVLCLCPSAAFAQNLGPQILPPTDQHQNRHREQFVEADYLAPADGRVRMVFESDGRVQSVVVERRLRAEAVDRAGRYHDILGSATCLTPCVMFIPPGQVQVRTHGPGLRDGAFDLEVPHESTRVLLRAGLRGRYDLGTGLVAAGATVFLAEVLVAAIAQGVGAPPAVPSMTGATPNNPISLSPAIAITVAGVAAALVATGIPLLVGQRTGVAQMTRAPDVARWTPRVTPAGAVWVF